MSAVIASVLASVGTFLVTDRQIDASRDASFAAVSSSVVAQAQSNRLDAYEQYADAADRHVVAVLDRSERRVRETYDDLQRLERRVAFRGTEDMRRRARVILNRAVKVTAASGDDDAVSRLAQRQQTDVGDFAEVGRAEDLDGSTILIETAGAD